tara:strand:- start:30811 stop:31455 length:645 start_codon:yes stop_codon:yes gene_type:complete
MSIHFGSSRFVFAPMSWEPELLAKLESHHVVAWGSDSALRTRFGVRIKQYLDAQAGTEVLVLHGRGILDLEGFCAQLERLIPTERLARTVNGAHGVASILRQDGGGIIGSPIRQRYFLWHDADVLLRSNPELFAQLVEVIAGVSAELEFGNDGGMLIQRGIYFGGLALAEYAREPDGQFQSWEADGPGVPFWSLVSGVDRPSTSLCSIEAIMND